MEIFHIDLGNMTRKNKLLFIINALLGIGTIGTQFFLISFYRDIMPTGVMIASILSLLAYFLLVFIVCSIRTN